MIGNVVIPNYNKYSKLTLTQKIEKHLSTHAQRLVFIYGSYQVEFNPKI